MSPPTLLIIASLVAAVAFFLAGFLLAPSRTSDAPPREAQPQPEALAKEDLRRSRADAEKERDSARAESERLAAQEKILAERLRVAEDTNHALFEREEKAAEGWAEQLEAAKAEQKRHDLSLEKEVEELRARLLRAQEERERLALRADQNAARAENATAALDELRRHDEQETERRAREREGERERLAKLVEEAAAGEQRFRDRLEDIETAAQAKLAEAEASGRASATAALADLRIGLTQAEAERSELAQQMQRERSERQSAEASRQEFELRMRAAEEVVEALRAEVASVDEARRAAQERAKDLERLALENAELREQQARAEREVKAGREDIAKDARVELAAAQAKLAEFDRVLEENRRLRDEVAELRTHQEASGDLERLTVAHKQVRLDAELMARRLQELLHDQAELVPLRAQAAEAVSLAEEVEYLRRREKDLEAQLYASGSYSSREMPAATGEVPVVAPVTDLESNLSALVGGSGPRTAVLADAQGFLIAAAGESVAEEGLAAFAAVAGEMVTRARMLLPLADVRSVRVTDENHMVLTCHLFTSAGEGLGVTTLGPGEPKAEETTRAIAGLAAIVSGADTAGEDTPEPAT